MFLSMDKTRHFMPSLSRTDCHFSTKIGLNPITLGSMQPDRTDHLSRASDGTIADIDPQETAEWREAFDSLIRTQGPERARLHPRSPGAACTTRRHRLAPELCTPYVNSIPVDRQAPFPGNLAIEERLGSLMRWNALAMVVRANQAYGELGGHIASYASAADLFEVGFNHFFRARTPGHGGDLVFFQPHSAPGVYARAFLEGRLSAADLRPLPPGAHRAGTSNRQRRPWPVELPASLADARLLAVPHRLDGHRSDQLDLPRPLHALPDRSPAARLQRPQSLGRLR